MTQFHNLTPMQIARSAQRSVCPAGGLRPRLLCVLISSIFSLPAGSAMAAAAAPTASMKFDSGFFVSGVGQQTDLSRFEQGNVVLPGTYLVDILVNESRVTRQNMTFSAVPDQNNAVPCFDRAALIKFGVDLGKVARGDGHRSAAEVATHQIPDGPLCSDLNTWIPGATTVFDGGEQSLSISVPQIYMNRAARGYVDPSQLDNGVTAAILSYNFNTSSAISGGSAAGGTQSYMGLNGGVNLGDWRLRHQGAVGWSSTTGRNAYQNTATFAQRDISALHSQLIIGDAFTNGTIMDSVRLRGVSMATDDRQTPQSQQGYAPIVRGMAESNAKVTITQNKYTIYETTVAPGPFVIDDLYATGYGGDLNVTVTEADGRKNTFVVPYAALPQLLRPGATKYSVAAGQLTQHDVAEKAPFVMQVTLQHGFNNYLTGYGGITASTGYTQTKIGTAVSTPIGAFSVDATTSRAQVPGNGILQGQSYGIAYNKNIPESGTNFSLGAYRFSTNGYLSLPDAVNVRSIANSGGDINQYSRQKSRLDVNIGQALSSGSMYLSGSSIDYWHGTGRQTSFSAGYGNTWHKMNWNLTVQRSRTQAAALTPEQEQQKQIDDIFFGSGYSKGHTDNRIMLTLSMPLGGGSNNARAPNATSYLTHNTGDTSSNNLQVGLNGNLGEERTLNYALSGSHNSGTTGVSNYFNANAGYQANIASVRGGYSQSGNSAQVSFSADGGIIAHPGGVSFSQSLGDAIGIVEATGAEGAHISTSPGVRVDGRGYAVVPYLMPYQNNTVDIDPKGSSDDVEFKTTTLTSAPRAGSVVMMKFQTDTARAIIIKVLRGNGKPLPFAAEVFDEKEHAVGVIGQGGKAFVRVTSDSGTLHVKWGDAADNQCHINYQLPAKIKGKMSADIVDGRCELLGVGQTKMAEINDQAVSSFDHVIDN